MTKTRILVATAALVASATPGFADYLRAHPIRYGNTSDWYYDNRDDDRDFPTNGLFPGNFAANRLSAAIGAAGWLESSPWRSARAYPSQVIFEKRCNDCRRRLKK